MMMIIIIIIIIIILLIIIIIILIIIIIIIIIIIVTTTLHLYLIAALQFRLEDFKGVSNILKFAPIHVTFCSKKKIGYNDVLLQFEFTKLYIHADISHPLPCEVPTRIILTSFQKT